MPGLSRFPIPSKKKIRRAFGPSDELDLSGAVISVNTRQGAVVLNLNDLILMMASMSTFADDAAAAAGGLASGTPYKTATGELRIKL